MNPNTQSSVAIPSELLDRIHTYLVKHEREMNLGMRADIHDLIDEVAAARAQASTDAGIESMQSDATLPGYSDGLADLDDGHAETSDITVPVSVPYLAEMERQLAECLAEFKRAGIAAAKASRAPVVTADELVGVLRRIASLSVMPQTALAAIGYAHTMAKDAVTAYEKVNPEA